jgi:hypothetical protein
LYISFICCFRVLFCVFRVFIAEEVERGEDKESGDTTTVDVQTLLEAFLNMSLISACFHDDAFFQ